MPEDVLQQLNETVTKAAYDERPHYQRNDYLAWIGRAKRSDTREKRIAQMLAELAEGGIYMGMGHSPSKKR